MRGKADVQGRVDVDIQLGLATAEGGEHAMGVPFPAARRAAVHSG
jgi:hypothetical protein